MLLTTESLKRFEGGQLEVQNEDEGYVYRGKIDKIRVENNRLFIVLRWNARGDQFPPKKWVNDENLLYNISLVIYTSRDIGPSDHPIGGDNRLSLHCPYTGELAVLFPPNGSKLDPQKIEGLSL